MTRWVPVTERLPEPGQRVIALTAFGPYIWPVFATYRYLFQREVEWTPDAPASLPAEYAITHWMPAPAPPGAEPPPPTKAQARVLDAARRFLRDEQRTPSLADLASEVGVSRVTVREHLRNLERRGFVRLAEGRVVGVNGGE